MEKTSPARDAAQNTGLKKQLNPMSVWALAFGCIIGWGSFFNPGLKFLPKAGTLGTTIAMLLGAVIMMIIAVSYNYLIPRYPTAGGEFAYTRAIFGPQAAYVCGWFLVLAYLTNVPMNATTLGYMTRFLFNGLFQWGGLYTVAGFDVYLGEVLISLTAIVLLALFSVKGVKVAGTMQSIFALSLAGSVLIIAIAALCSPYTHLADLKPLFAPTAQNGGEAFSGVIAILALAPWAYVGFDTIPQSCEEFNFSHQKVFRLMMIAICFGAFVYISNNLVAAAALANNYAEAIQDPSISWLLGTAVKNILGTPGLVLLGIALSCAILTGLLGFLTATSRLMYSMANRGYLPSFFGKLNAKTGTPMNAIIFCALISMLGPWFGRTALGWLVDMSSIGAAIGFGFTCVAAAVTVKQRRDVKNWRFIQVMSLIGGVFSLGFIVMFLPGLPAALDMPSWIMLAVWIVLGLAFYVTRSRKNELQ